MKLAILTILLFHVGIVFSQDSELTTAPPEPTPDLSTTSFEPFDSPTATTASVVLIQPTTCPFASPPFKIHPNGHGNKCLDVRGGVFANGTPVQIYDCNGTGAQRWRIIHHARTKVVLDGTDYCLDAGTFPANGVGMKIWKCFNNLPAQDWRYTTNNRIVLTNQGLCLDLPNGNLNNWNQIQTWQCTANNQNQIWTTSL